MDQFGYVMLRQIKHGNLKEVLHNFYIWCGDEEAYELLSKLVQNNNLIIVNTDKLNKCLENMYINTADIWLEPKAELSTLLNKHDIFIFDNKLNLDINLTQVEYMQNPHILPKVATDICIDFILTSL